MRLLPQSLFGRMALILIGGLVVVQTLSVLFHLLERDRLLVSASSMESAQRIADAVRLLNALAPDDRHKLMTAVHSPGLHISLDGPRPILAAAKSESAPLAASSIKMRR